MRVPSVDDVAALGDPCRPGAPRQQKMLLPRTSGMALRTASRGHRGLLGAVRRHPTGWAHSEAAHLCAVHPGDSLPCGVSCAEQ